MIYRFPIISIKSPKKNWFLFCLLAVTLILCKKTFTQSFVEDLFKGKILSSEPGVWAFYEIMDKTQKTRLLLRQSITGTEKIDGETTALWLESEIIPTEGFPSVFRFLISYDKNGKEKIHKIVMREGANPPQNIEGQSMSETTENTLKKKFIGEEEIEFKNGKIKTKHYEIEEDNTVKEIWLNDEVKPLGIVKLSTNEGDMILVKYGKGGEESRSALDVPVQKSIKSNSIQPHVDVSTTETKKKNNN